jgi:hypothetical protein
MDVWVDGQIGEQTNGQKFEQVNGQTDGQKY